jgi:hypothetical protein
MKQSVEMPKFDNDEIRARKKSPRVRVGFRAVNHPTMVPNERVQPLLGFEEDPNVRAALEKEGELLGDEIADSIAGFRIGGEEGDPHRDPSMEMPAYWERRVRLMLSARPSRRNAPAHVQRNRR